LAAQVGKHRSLHDREAGAGAVVTDLSIVHVGGASPTRGAFGRDAGGGVAGGVLETFVEDHHDVRSEGDLNIDGRFGSEQVLVAVQVRAKDDAGFGDFAQRAQAEDLETAGIGKDRPGPAHEFVEAAKSPDGFVAGPEIQMIGIAEEDFSVEIVEDAQTRRNDGRES
jgi:hypothetical protein